MITPTHNMKWKHVCGYLRLSSMIMKSAHLWWLLKREGNFHYSINLSPTTNSCSEEESLETLMKNSFNANQALQSLPLNVHRNQLLDKDRVEVSNLFSKIIIGNRRFGRNRRRCFNKIHQEVNSSVGRLTRCDSVAFSSPTTVSATYSTFTCVTKWKSRGKWPNTNDKWKNSIHCRPRSNTIRYFIPSSVITAIRQRIPMTMIVSLYQFPVGYGWKLSMFHVIFIYMIFIPDKGQVDGERLSIALSWSQRLRIQLFATGSGVGHQDQ